MTEVIHEARAITNITAPDIPMAVPSRLETPRNGHIPRKRDNTKLYTSTAPTVNSRYFIKYPFLKIVTGQPEIFRQSASIYLPYIDDVELRRLTGLLLVELRRGEHIKYPGAEFAYRTVESDKIHLTVASL